MDEEIGRLEIERKVILFYLLNWFDLEIIRVGFTDGR
jgi:hypothetical protein